MRVAASSRGTPDGRHYVLRSLERSEAGSLLDHAWLIHTREPEVGWPEPDEFQHTVEQIRALAARLGKADNGLLLAALAGPGVIGQLVLEGGTLEKMRHVGALGISVHAAWRRQGVARSLMDLGIEAARGSGVLRRLTLEVFDPNRPGIRLYESLGFKVEGRRRGHVRIAGEYRDVLLMALDL